MIENNNEKENRELYRQTFDEIHASEELLERIKSMKKKRTITKLARFGYAAAAAAAVFVASNGITYAATGESWTEKVIIYINGSVGEYDTIHITDEDGNSQTYYNIDLDGNGSINIGDDSASVFFDGDSPDTEYSISVIEDGTEKIYVDVRTETLDVDEGESEINALEEEIEAARLSLELEYLESLETTESTEDAEE
ncbi:MAG: hypothetical protein LIO37_01340 [Clostridiales bacterium]|nr:hypothetical protein [Clostridiales bacterium]